MIKVKGYPHLYRDENTGAIVNYNDQDYNVRLQSISNFEKEKGELKRMREDIDELKGLIKQLLVNR